MMIVTEEERVQARLESEYKYVADTQSKVVHAKREVAKKALVKGSTPEFVADITGLSLDDIRRL